jgi:exodeoxyribonuclease III
MKIVSYNVAGLRSILKKLEFEKFINDDSIYDILCIQETKAEEHQVKIPDYINAKYSYRFYNSTKGISQRKGLSGVSIWCSTPPINNLGYPDFDIEGRILTLEFEKFILINVYVPNSQSFDCQRYHFRDDWNVKFSHYIAEIKKNNKEIIICGDFNVAHLDNDISNPKLRKNKVAGFFDNERSDFAYLLETNNLIDAFRNKYPEKRKSTYWSNFLKSERTKENGWGIDYFLVTNNLNSKVNDITIMKEIKGSDHCPIVLDFNI